MSVWRKGCGMTEQTWTVLSVIALLSLLGNALLDLKERRISLVVALLPGLAGFLARALCGQLTWTEIAWGLLPALAAGMLLLASRGGVGAGDVWVLLGLGFCLERGVLLETLTAGLLFSALWAGILLMAGRRGSDTLPFVPFLLAGYLLAGAASLFL